MKVKTYAAKTTRFLGEDMSKSKFNGTINGKRVKVIVIDKGHKKMWFAKSKDFDVNTPHFERNIGGTLEVHLDSADGNSFRAMSVNDIYSGSIYSGTTLASNEGMDMVVLPMSKEADGFAIDTSKYGTLINYKDESKNWCLMAFGSFSSWQKKDKK